MEPITAYWFAASDRLPHGDGRRVVVGKSHSLRGEIVICRHALHASREPYDALQNAPGLLLYKVECSGDVVEKFDKLGCRTRKYVAMIDATELLRRFAREQAFSVIHLWDAPQVVKDYLTTGDESLRDAAAAAASDAWTAVVAASNVWTTAAASRAWAAAAAADARAWAASAAARAATADAWTAASDARAAAATARAWAASDARAAAADQAAARHRFNQIVTEAFERIEA